jgi:hypothetical protein
VAHRTPAQRARRRQIERVIGVAAPFLDVVLFAGDRLSRVAGRNEIQPDPPRRLRDAPRGVVGATAGERGGDPRS